MKKRSRQSSHPFLLFLLLLYFTATAPAFAAENPQSQYVAPPKESLHIYLLIGQSNMAGRSLVRVEDTGVVSGCYLFDSQGRWEPARNPFNRYSTIRRKNGRQGMNPGYTFCQAMGQHAPAISIGLVVNARGGTSIKTWAKGSNNYNEAIRRARQAEKTGTLEGILWHQGEADAYNTQYLQKLKQLISDLRSDLENENLIFVAGQVRDGTPVNQQIAKLPEEVPWTAVVSSNGLNFTGRWHFDTDSMKILGQRYAEEVLKLQKNQMPNKAASTIIITENEHLDTSSRNAPIEEMPDQPNSKKPLTSNSSVKKHMVLKPVDILSRIRLDSPELLNGLTEEKATQLVRSTLEQIAKNVAETEEGVVRVEGFGKFRVVQREKADGYGKKMIRRVFFKPLFRDR